MQDADFIIVGAGSAGCVLANRLSVDGRAHVLLLEAGGADTRREVKIPAAFSKMFKSEVDWNFSTAAEPHVDGRVLYWPRGKMLGGSSSINAMMYVRGHRGDYDGWRQSGNVGWGYDDVLTYFKLSEGLVSPRGEAAFHGSGGPMAVSDQRSPNPMTAAFVEAAIAAGLKRNDDVNGAGQDGVGYTHVMQANGQRNSAADAFLRPALSRTTLKVETECLVERIIFEGARAVGVAVRHGGRSHTVKARRAVILAAGAIGSPHLLLLSGVGPAAQLQRHGIAVVKDLVGVGTNLQDHLSAGISYFAKTANSLAGAETVPNLLRYVFMKKGPLTSNVAEALAFIHTRPGLVAGDIELIFAPAFFVAHGAGNPPGHGFTIGAVLLRPDSRGSIELASTDPTVAPVIRANYLSTTSDRETLRAGIRFARSVAQQTPFDSVRGAEFIPGEDVTSDAALDAVIRQRCESLYHPVGTCKMGQDAAAVVNHGLAVHGTQGLFVADASIMPTIIGGHTHAPTVMIAEKAAVMIKAM